MSILAISGEAWAAGLLWIPRKRGGGLEHHARANAAVAFAHTPRQTGLAGAEDGDPVGTVSLAAALQEHLAAQSWIAVVAADDGRIALIRCNAGRFDERAGDEVYASSDEVKRLLEAPTSGYEIFASPSLDIDGATPLDLSTVGITDDMRLQPAPEAPATAGALRIVANLAVAGLVAFAAWDYRRDVWEIFFPPPPAPAVTVEGERELVAAIDSTALLAACDEALQAIPPGLPAWSLDEATCWAELVEAPVLQEIPDLHGRAALVLRWTLKSGHDIEIHRRLVEALFPLQRHVGFVHGTGAWAVTELGPVITEVDAAARPIFLDLRAEIDRRLGPWASAIAYSRGEADEWTIAITGTGPLARARKALDPVAGIEVLSLSRNAAGEWQIAARPLRPRVLLESTFLRLSQPMTGGSHATM